MNNRSWKNINLLIKLSVDFWFNLQKEFGFKEEEFCCITFYDTKFYEKHKNEDLELIRASSMKADMSTISYCIYSDDSEDKDHPENNIIEDIVSHIYMSYEDLFELIIDCELNYDKVLECMKFTLRHELGHIMYHRAMFIGKRYEEWLMHARTTVDTYIKMPKLRKNASIKKRWNWFCQYMNTGIEREANIYAKITDEDLRDQFMRIYGG